MSSVRHARNFFRALRRLYCRVKRCGGQSALIGIALQGQGCPTAADLRPRWSLFVAVLDASDGSTVGTRRCDELKHRLAGEVVESAGELRVVALRTGGRNGSPVLLADSTFRATRSGFATHGAVEACKLK